MQVCIMLFSEKRLFRAGEFIRIIKYVHFVAFHFFLSIQVIASVTSHAEKVYLESLNPPVGMLFNPLYTGRLFHFYVLGHLSFYGCQIYFVAFILFLMENHVSKQFRP